MNIQHPPPHYVKKRGRGRERTDEKERHGEKLETDAQNASVVLACYALSAYIVQPASWYIRQCHSSKVISSFGFVQ